MSDPQAERDDRLAQVLDEALSAWRQRGTVDLSAWQARHPDLADDLPVLFDTLRNLDTAMDDWRGAELDVTRSFSEEPYRLDRAPLEVLPVQIGRYRILECLGAGGMGTVYRAEDPQLQRSVALKVPRFDGSPRYRQLAVKRFLREARAAAQVRHPHVCSIHDVGEQDGIPYVVMDFVEGQSLAERLADGRRFEDPREAVLLIRQVADALQAVHDRSLIHRDLKPGNILLDTTGRAVLTDFGLARSAEDVEPLTADGALLGTPGYMAPEQATGAALGLGIDIYGLGVVLYQALTGRLPFEGPVVGVLSQIAQATPPPPSRFRPDLDPALEAIVLKAMARRPEDRYASARALADDLDRWLAGSAATLTQSFHAIPAPATPAAPAQPASKARRAPAVVRAELPDGSAVTVKVKGASPGQVTVKVLEEQGKRKRRRRRLFVSVTVSLALLLAVIDASLWLLPGTPKAPPAGEFPGQVAMRNELPADYGAQAPAAKELPAMSPVVSAPNPTERDKAPHLGGLGAGAKSLNAEDGVQFFARQAEQHRKEGKTAVALGEAEMAVQVARQTFGDDDPRTAVCLSNLAELYQLQGQYPRAEQLYQESLRIQEAKLGSNDTQVATNLNNLAGLYLAQGEAARAEPLCRRSLAIAERRLSQDDPVVANSLNNLAQASRAVGKPHEAMVYTQRALDLQEKRLRADPSQADSVYALATAYNNLGDVARSQGKLDQALNAHQQALNLQQKMETRDESRPVAVREKARSLNGLGLVYLERGEMRQADDCFQQALTLQERVLGRDHPDLATTLENRARVLRKTNQAEEAARLEAQAQALRGRK